MEQRISFEKNPPFVVADSYYQKWVGGVEEAGSGVNLHIDFSSLETDVVIIDIYFRKQILEAKFSKQAPKKYFASWRSDNIPEVIMHIEALNEAQNKPFPFDLKDDEAVLAYWFGGQEYFYKISDIPEKQMISYPGSKPTQ